MVTIVVDQSLSNSSFYEYRCLENIKKLRQLSGNYDDQQQYKSILEATKVSTLQGFPENPNLICPIYVYQRNQG